MSDTSGGTVLESRTEFKETPQGQYNYWSEELKASQKMLRQWHKQADNIADKYRGEGRVGALGRSTDSSGFKLNLFHSNVVTLESMLYGNTPKIDVSRRYADPNDDVARVAAEMMERLLNLDIAQNGEEVECVFKAALQDRLVAGLGAARLRYTVETEGEEGQEQMTSEDAPIDYYFWGDLLWSWCRNWGDMRWLAFRNYLTKDEVEARWGKEAAEGIELKKQKMAGTDEQESEPDKDDAWMKAEIWEIWDKESRSVHFMAFGYDKVLEKTPDPLQLGGFFPCPPFFLANPTTSLYIPTPDYTMAQDLYTEIDTLQTRISIITDAVKVVGVYDKGSEDIGRMMNEGVENDLIPVDNWALFAEKGGIQGAVDWLPIQDIAAVLEKLVMLRDQSIGLLQQVTGMSDIMQGGLGNQYEGVGQSEMKAKFGSTRIQRLQDQFARFASDLMQIKAEIIAKHFDPQTIVQRSGMQHTFDAEHIPAAVELIKRPAEAKLRVEIRPESVAMVDYAQLKNERTEYMNALSTFMQSASPLMEQDPTAKPFLLQLLQWGLAGFKGASEIEGVIDKAIEASMQAEKERQENPEPDAEQKAMEMQQQMEQMKNQMQMQVIQAKAQADMQLREQDKQADMETAFAQHQSKIAEIEGAMQAKLAEIDAKMQSDALLEQIQSGINVQQAQATAEAQVQQDMAGTQLEIEKEAAKTSLKIREIAASSEAKIKEARAKPAPKGPSSDNK